MSLHFETTLSGLLGSVLLSTAPDTSKDVPSFRVHFIVVRVGVERVTRRMEEGEVDNRVRKAS